MNYKIITDFNRLKEFIDWLPELKDDECYYVMLFARDKYFKEVGKPSDKLKRFTSNKQFLLDKIKQLECEVGSYKYGDLVIPNEALCLYIMPNPRSQVKAAKNLTKTLIDKVFSDYNGYNIHQEALTMLQKTPSKVRFMDFDFDYTTIEEMSQKISDIINKNINNLDFYAPCCGSCWVEAEVKAKNMFLSDYHFYLIEMWKAFQNGYEPIMPITEEIYQHVKANLDEDPALSGFVGFGCSFGGKW